MRSMVEGQVRLFRTCQDHSHVPLHHSLREWSPSPKGEE